MKVRNGSISSRSGVSLMFTLTITRDCQADAHSARPAAGVRSREAIDEKSADGIELLEVEGAQRFLLADQVPDRNSHVFGDAGDRLKGQFAGQFFSHPIGAARTVRDIARIVLEDA